MTHPVERCKRCKAFEEVPILDMNDGLCQECLFKERTTEPFKESFKESFPWGCIFALAFLGACTIIYLIINFFNTL